MRNITWVACLVALLACGDPTDQVSAGDTDPILDRYGAGSLFGCWQFEFDQGEGESQVWPVAVRYHYPLLAGRPARLATGFGSAPGPGWVAWDLSGQGLGPVGYFSPSISDTVRASVGGWPDWLRMKFTPHRDTLVGLWSHQTDIGTLASGVAVAWREPCGQWLRR